MNDLEVHHPSLEKHTVERVRGIIGDRTINSEEHPNIDLLPPVTVGVDEPVRIRIEKQYCIDMAPYSRSDNNKEEIEIRIGLTDFGRDEYRSISVSAWLTQSRGMVPTKTELH